MDYNRDAANACWWVNFPRGNNGGKNKQRKGHRREHLQSTPQTPAPVFGMMRNNYAYNNNAASLLGRPPVAIPIPMMMPNSSVPSMSTQQVYQVPYMPQIPAASNLNNAHPQYPNMFNQQQYTPAFIHGSTGSSGTDLSGRGALPLSAPTPLYSTPPPAVNPSVSPAPPLLLNENGSWLQPTAVMMVDQPLMHQMPPASTELNSAPMNVTAAPTGFEVVPVSAYSNNPPLPAHSWQENGCTYFDPNQGYFTGNIPYDYEMQQELVQEEYFYSSVQHDTYSDHEFDNSSYSNNLAVDISAPPNVMPLEGAIAPEVQPPDEYNVCANTPAKLETIYEQTSSNETEETETQVLECNQDSDAAKPLISVTNFSEINENTEEDVDGVFEFDVPPSQDGKVPTDIQKEVHLIVKTLSKPDGVIPIKQHYNYGQRHCGHGGLVKTGCVLHSDSPVPLHEAHSQQRHEAPISTKPPTIIRILQNPNHQAVEYSQKQSPRFVPRLVKDVYEEAPEVANLTDDQVSMIRQEKNNISVQYLNPGELREIGNADIKADKSGQIIPIPKPVTSFDQCFKNYPELMKEIVKQGFSEPFPIQCQMWPCILKGMDVVGIAQTGSGKTLAYLLPAFIHIEKQPKPREQRKGPSVLILVPTRELAQQIDKQVIKYSYKNIRSACVYGGGSRFSQIEAIKLQPDIIIATPGRLIDLMNNVKLNLNEVSMLIFDEADEMLNQGFGPQVQNIFLAVRDDCQTIMTSSTWPDSVKKIACKYTKNPVMLVVGGSVEARAVSSVKQSIIILHPDKRFCWVVDFAIKMGPNDRAIIFVCKKELVDCFVQQLAFYGIAVKGIHGGHGQRDRDQAIADMKTGHAKILVATDIASRGLDIDNITHIINYNFPDSAARYVHRIGRTGRAGKTGESYTFFGFEDWAKARQLIELLQDAQQEVPSELLNMAERFEYSHQNGMHRGGRREDKGCLNRGDCNVERVGGQFNSGYRGGFGRFNNNNGAPTGVGRAQQNGNIARRGQHY